MKIPLGISVAVGPTIGELLDRAVERGELMAAGQGLLKYLSDESFFRGARLEINDGRFQLDATLPANPQPDVIGHARGNRVGRANPLLRQDDIEQQASDEAVAGLENSARVLDLVAEALAMLPLATLHNELKMLERREGVDTRPARSFIYHKHEGFMVEVEDEVIPFFANEVRTAVAADESVEIVMTRVQSRAQSTVFKGLVHEAQGDGKYEGLQSGGKHEFRFVGLSGWQKVLLEAACWLKLPICLEAVETLSTCTLEHTPSDVHQVHNWFELLEGTLEALRKVRDAANDGQPEERREAA